jgi:hypothetical protein
LSDKIGKAAWKVAEAINKAKAYLIGNGMEKVLSEALKLFEKLPEDQRTAERLMDLLTLGIEKRHEEGTIRIQLRREN